ncbi:MAG: outer membrane protein assembly factor BamB [Pseudomonadota bacterium]
MTCRQWALVFCCLALSSCGGGGFDGVKDSVTGLFNKKEVDVSTLPTELNEEFEDSIEVERLWSVSVGKGTGEFYLRLDPVAEYGLVFGADRFGRLVALDQETGKRVWQVHDKKIVYTSGPGVGDGLVMIGTQDARVIAREAESGKVRWVARVSSEVLAAPAASGGVAVVRTADGKLIGLDSSSGAEIWLYDRSVPILTLRGTSKPAIHDERVIAGFDNGRVVALELRTGRSLWEKRLAVPSGRSDLERIVDVDAQPVIRGSAAYIAGFNGGVAALRIDDGSILWNREISSFNDLAVDARKVYVTDEVGAVWALDRFDGTSVWKQDDLLRRKLTGPALYEGHAVVGDFEGYVHWLDLDGGKLVFRDQIDNERLISTPTALDTAVVTYTSSGRLAAMRLR